MAIGTIIRQLRKERGLTLNQLAALIESDVGNLSRLERGVQGYSDATLKKIAGALQVPMAAFFEDLGGEENVPQSGTYQMVRASEEDDAFVAIRKATLQLQAGIKGFEVEPEPENGDTLVIPAAWLRKKGFDPRALIALTIKGESMETTFHEGDVVVINTQDAKPVDGSVYAVNYEGEAVIKRLSRDAGDWWLTSDNPDQRKYHRKICRGDACILIGRVVRSESERF
jgi:phage repressor protein C with HTH and peptisase S24 domain